ncbi:MAG: right-handed parallel beta-helix repeat-containing protein [Phycisphaerales bacterium]
MKNYKLLLIFIIVFYSHIHADIIFINNQTGSDENPGTKQKPLKTLLKAAEITNNNSFKSGLIIRLSPGIYNLDQTLIFNNSRFSAKNRLIIEAEILPDDPNWHPDLMPIIISSQYPVQKTDYAKQTETYSIKIKNSYVTVQGLKFLGNPLLNNWHCCLERVGVNLEDLLVRQCMFIGAENTLNVYCAALATGDKFVLENNIFYHCDSAVVFWDGPGKVPGKDNALRNCIIYGSKMAAVWTCQTSYDFDFRNNIVSNCEYFWLRQKGDIQRYRLYDSIITGNRFYSGYGLETGPTGVSGKEVSFEEKDIVKDGILLLDMDKLAKSYLHPKQGTFGSDIKAGLCAKEKL